MPDRYDYNTKRLWVEDELFAAAEVTFSAAQSNYLVNVLRMKEGTELLLFNGRQGEWRATLVGTSKRGAMAQVSAQCRPQPAPYDFLYAFAPIKVGRMDYLIQKAVEMGVGTLQPLITDYTQSSRLKDSKLHAHIVEAAAQCGILSLPALRPVQKLTEFIDSFEHQHPDRVLIFCDEANEGATTNEQLDQVKADRMPALLIGPEGGFSSAERDLLRQTSFVRPIGLGPRILRADTAAVAAMAALQMHFGDW